MKARSRTPEPPYCWQSKVARRAIREAMNGNGCTPALLSLYDALCEIASNEGKESFEAGQPHIGTLAGMSARNVRRLEPLLEQVGVVHIVRPALRGHCTYTLLSFGRNVPTFGHEENSKCPPVEEQVEKPKKPRSRRGKVRCAMKPWKD